MTDDKQNNRQKLQEDAAARITAIDVRHSVIVKAPAGSGKTELLVQRYLALLGESCDHPKQLVAITFTRKAAAEMRRRLKYELLRTEPPAEEHKKRTYELAQKVRRKVEKGGAEWRLHHLIDAETVTTIDGFCRTLMALDADKAQFYDIPELVTGHRQHQMYYEAVERAFDRLRHTKRHRAAMSELLYRHGNETDALIKNFAGLLENRADLLQVMLTANYNAGEELAELAALLMERLTENAPAQVFRKHLGILSVVSKNLAKAYGNAPASESVPAAESMPIAEHHTGLADWQALGRALLTKSEGSLRKRPVSDMNMNIAQKDEMKTLLKDLSEENAFLFIEQLGRAQLWTQHYDKDENEMTDYVRLLFKESAADLMVLFRTKGCCDYTEVLLASQRVTDAQDAPTLLAERLGYQLRHLLVDEFQDTSSAQLRLLENLSQSWDLSVNNTLFLVGDPMQSVYSFRNANVRIFNHLWRSGRLRQVQLKRIQLSCNYRSGQTLVNWFNENFAQVLSAEAAEADKNSLTDTVGYTPSLTPDATGDSAGNDQSQVPVNCAVTWDKESGGDELGSDAEKHAPLLDQLKEIKNKQPDDSIAILASKRAQLIPLLSILADAGLDFQAPEILGISDSMLINDLTSLMRCLHSRSDRLAWYSLLRSPWCGLTLPDLNALAGKDDKQTTDIPTLLAKIAGQADTGGKPVQNLSQDGVKRISLLQAALADSLRDAGRFRLVESLERAWHSLGGRALLKDEHDEEELSMFLRVLEENSNAGRVDPAGISAQLKEEALALQSQGQIQVMTVHKAKGLEFDHVFLPNMHKSSLAGNKGNDTIRVLSFSKTPDEKESSAQLPIETAILALRFPIDGKDSRSARKMLDFIRKEREEQEQRRLFYVACTRARKSLYMHYEEPARDYRGAFRNYISAALSGEQTLVVPTASTAAEEPAKTQAYRPLQRIPLAEREKQIMPSLAKKQAAGGKPAGKQKESQIDKTDKTADRSIRRWYPPSDRARGLLIHQLMEALSLADAQIIEDKKKYQQLLQTEIANALPSLRETGLSASLIERLVKEAQSCMEITLADERGRWILAPQDADAHAEWALLLPDGKEAKQIRLDRSFLDKGTRWIVDYKTFEPNNPLSAEAAERDYKEQLVRYAKALTSWQEARNRTEAIKVGIYCPQNASWFAWDYDTATGDISPISSPSPA